MLVVGVIATVPAGPAVYPPQNGKPTWERAEGLDGASCAGAQIAGVGTRRRAVHGPGPAMGPGISGSDRAGGT